MPDQQRTTMPRPRRRSDLPRLNLPCALDVLEERKNPDMLTFAAGRHGGRDTVACLLNGGGTTFIDEEGARQLFIWLGRWLHKPS